MTAAGPRKKRLIGWKSFCKLWNSFQIIQLTPDNWTTMTNYPKACPERKKYQKSDNLQFKLETLAELHNQPLLIFAKRTFLNNPLRLIIVPSRYCLRQKICQIGSSFKFANLFPPATNFSQDAFISCQFGQQFLKLLSVFVFLTIICFIATTRYNSHLIS